MTRKAFAVTMVFNFLAAVMLASTAAAESRQEVTFWVSSRIEIDLANTKIAAVSKVGKIKLGKACAGTAGQFQLWQAMSVDPRGGRDGEIVEIVSNGVPASAEVLASLRVEGTCTEGKTTWTKYSGIVEKGKPKPRAKPTAKPAATAKPTSKPK